MAHNLLSSSGLGFYSRLAALRNWAIFPNLRRRSCGNVPSCQVHDRKGGPSPDPLRVTCPLKSSPRFVRDCTGHGRIQERAWTWPGRSTSGVNRQIRALVDRDPPTPSHPARRVAAGARAVTAQLSGSSSGTLPTAGPRHCDHGRGLFMHAQSHVAERRRLSRQWVFSRQGPHPGTPASRRPERV